MKEIMLSTGGKVSQVDPAVLYWLDEHCEVEGDDFLWAGTQQFVTNVIPRLKSVFRVGCEEHENVCYVEMDIVNVNGIIEIHQHSYVENITRSHATSSCCAKGFTT